MSYPYRLYLDPINDPPDQGMLWRVARSYDEAVRCVEDNGVPFFLSLAHDLWVGPSGYDFAVWLSERMIEGVSVASDFRVVAHRASTVEEANIRQCLSSALAFARRTKAAEFD